jgi:CubicO group peptidase (beta-lactamase class C family)
LLGLVAVQSTDQRRAKIEAIFAPYATTDAPGCAVGISEEGKTVFAKGYGMADLAWSIPIRPDTRFDIASDAKQFTAFSVALLAKRGALSLDDDIRKFIPELRDLGHRVTLRHMLGMQSGLPDFLTLGTITSRRGGSKFTPEIGLRLVRDIRALDFEPGTDWTYSNTNFLLLGLVAERVSGKPLSEFLQAEVFQPVGMKRTVYEPDPQPVIIERATPYAPSKNGFLLAPYPASDGGSKGVQSTVLDMLMWADALDSGRLAGPELAEAMRTPGRLKGGEPLTYGMGLESWSYRGAPIILHGGTGTGYRSQTIRFPSLRSAISVLCNRADANPDALVRSVADVWFGSRLEPLPTVQPFSPKHRAAAGEYINDAGLVFSLRFEGDQAIADGLTGERLRAINPAAFTYETGQRPAKLELLNGSEILHTPGQGRSTRYRRYTPVKPDSATLKAYEGRYHSANFQSFLNVTIEGGKLLLIHSNGTVQPLRPTEADRFTPNRTAAVTFERQNGIVQHLIFTTPRARRVVFERHAK